MTSINTLHIRHRLALGTSLLVSLALLFVVLSANAVGQKTDTLLGNGDRAAASCEQLDPKVKLAGESKGQLISKGLNLPPYLEDDLPGRINRLKASGVHWVRLEFVATRPPTPGNPVSQIDLAYYDQLVNGICNEGIAVLGLLDYQTLQRSDWAISNTVSADYLDEFTTVAAQLTDHFSDRIGVWEVWNEQDLAGTKLTEDAYATLLYNTYWAIQNVSKDEADGGDQVVFGGLGRIDKRALVYLRNVYNAFDTLYPGQRHPFDILALHPYSSELFGIETDPAIYFRWPEGEGPTVIHKFVKLMEENGDVNKPIWITEMGWNRALSHEPSFTCPAVSAGLVSDEEQVEYLNRGFDILFRETGESPPLGTPVAESGLPSVTKIFWYQYRDTGVLIDCGLRSGERARPIPTATVIQAASSSEVRPVAWWFGLYSGAFQPNQVQTAFRCYATGGSNCPAITPTFTVTPTPTITPTPTNTPTPQPTSSETSVVFLPVVVREGTVPTPAPTATPIPTAPSQ